MENNPLVSELENLGVKYISHESVKKSGKTRKMVTFKCACGETLTKEISALRGAPRCKACSKKVKSSSQPKKKSNDEIKMLVEEYDCELIGVSGIGAKKKFKIKCSCGRETERELRNLRTYGAKCSDCNYAISREKKKNKLNQEINKHMESLKFKVIEIVRDDSEKSRIHITFECKCGEINTKQWEVIKRKNFQGCEKCYKKYIDKFLSDVSKKPETKQKIIQTNKEKYGVNQTTQNSDVRKKYLENNGFRYQTLTREYIYQGLEIYAIQKLIDEGVDEMNIFTDYDLCSSKDFPEFWNEERSNRYFPDLYVKDERYNCFIEVKKETFANAEKTITKCEWVEAEGYKIIRWIFDRDGKFIEEI